MNFLIKKIFIIKVLVLSLSISFYTPVVKAEVGPKIIALGTMAAYGTVGGMLLGVASLAFGTNGRAIAQGASIGLYAGLLFGGYVVGSHAMKKHNRKMEEQGDNYYPDTEESPYESYFFQEQLQKEEQLKMKESLSDEKKTLYAQGLILDKNTYIKIDSKKKFFLPLVTFQF